MVNNLICAVGDIHGHYDLLLKMKEKLDDLKPNKVYFLGDYIDRGPQSREVVDWCISAPDNYHFIRGNHEDMALKCHADKGENFMWWNQNGGGATLKSYPDFKISPDHLEWFDTLPRLLYDEHRVFVHAMVDERYNLDEQPESVTQWGRYPLKADVGYYRKHVIHGHTPFEDGPELLSCRTNLDIGSFFTGSLACGVWEEDRSGGPIDIIKVKT